VVAVVGMAMAAGAALLRSVATKMARAPPRLPSALDHHGRLPTSSGGLWLSRFSTSTGGAMPPPANLRVCCSSSNDLGELQKKIMMTAS